MKKFLLLSLLIHVNSLFASTIKGTVTDKNKTPLSFASILIKGTGVGTSTNLQGAFFLNVSDGNYTIICQHIGYKTIEKKVKIKDAETILDFVLDEQQYTLNEVTVANNGEDPAYEIIRNAIKKREVHLNELNKFQCEVYIKGLIQLRDYPKKFLGEKVDFEDGDTSKRKIIFLSESIANYAIDGKDKQKIEVLSTRVSGSSDGFGLASPQIITFYENIISVGRGLNPRGFISPISNNALNYYKYKYEGSFVENDQLINRIKIIPKRNYEPLFSGYINIIEDEWRIQSADVMLLKNQQLQFLDTLKIQQLYVPINKKWIIKQQVIYPAGKFFNFDFFGSIAQVYSKFNLNPTFPKDYFNNTIIKYTDSSNKKTLAYWDSIRPLPLVKSEADDFIKKDSLEQVRKDPKYLDSLDRKNNKLNLFRLILTGQTFNNTKKKETFRIDPLLTSTFQFNTVEGWVTNLDLNYVKRFTNRKTLQITPTLRYGFSNTHFNPSILSRYTFGKKYFNSISLHLGSNVFQFDNNNPIDPFLNTFSTLNWTNNYLKTYEARFFKISQSSGLGNGLTLQTNINYQHRLPLENSTDFYWKKIDGRNYTPNYPSRISNTNIPEHKALSLTAEIIWRPGGKYVEFPDRKISIGSKYPTFSFSFTQGIPNVLGSNVDFSKWQFNVTDNLNLKLLGRINYKLSAGGFAHASKVFIPDMNHLIGNEISFTSNYLNSFQLLPYYTFSNTSKLYTTAHIEYHLNGFLTNKIPGFKKLNWFLVLGGNSFYNNDKKEGYYESLISLENIFKILRVDFIKAYPSSQTTNTTAIKFSTSILNRR